MLDSEKAVEKGRFPGPVRADQADRFALCYLERELAERIDAAETLRDIASFKERHRSLAPRPDGDLRVGWRVVSRQEVGELFGSIEDPPSPVLDDTFWVTYVCGGGEAEDQSEQRVVATRQIRDELLDSRVGEAGGDGAGYRVHADRRDDDDEDERELVVEVGRRNGLLERGVKATADTCNGGRQREGDDAHPSHVDADRGGTDLSRAQRGELLTERAVLDEPDDCRGDRENDEREKKEGSGSGKSDSDDEGPRHNESGGAVPRPRVLKEHVVAQERERKREQSQPEPPES